jgi:hypothetical protein
LAFYGFTYSTRTRTRGTLGTNLKVSSLISLSLGKD